jgi:hypothetical protein
MPVGLLLKGDRDGEHRILVERPSDELERDGEAVGETAGD